ncbi:hypothetical protein [Bifidobacterium tibiigranuli]|nr:hypothetical protein [Bifidobacterium tibiigranuli]
MNPGGHPASVNTLRKKMQSRQRALPADDRKAYTQAIYDAVFA